MPVKLTKAELKKILVEERAKQRVKHQRSAFMQRTASIYHGQQKRLTDLCADPAVQLSKKPTCSKLSYTLDEFRAWAERCLEHGLCAYCECKLTVKNMTPDHVEAIAGGGDWSLLNLALCCQKCNWEKGKMTGREFHLLLRFMRKYLGAESAADMKKRLSIGGKWTWR